MASFRREGQDPTRRKLTWSPQTMASCGANAPLLVSVAARRGVSRQKLARFPAHHELVGCSLEGRAFRGSPEDGLLDLPRQLEVPAGDPVLGGAPTAERYRLGDAAAFFLRETARKGRGDPAGRQHVDPDLGGEAPCQALAESENAPLGGGIDLGRAPRCSREDVIPGNVEDHTASLLAQAACRMPGAEDRASQIHV